VWPVAALALAAFVNARLEWMLIAAGILLLVAFALAVLAMGI
jgi:hypothetical protein